MTTVRWFVLLLAFIKVWEICQFIHWVFTKGSKYREDVLSLMPRQIKDIALSAQDLYDLEKKHNIPWPKFWLLHRHFLEIMHLIHNPLKSIVTINEFIGKWIDRQPIVIVAISVIVMGFPDRIFPAIEPIFIFSLMSLELIDLLSARIILGFVDNFRRDVSINPTVIHEDYHGYRDRFIGKFMLSITAFVLSSILGFGAIYYSIYCAYGSDNHAFNGLISNDIPIQVQLIYFSTTTFATVGYGDITPAKGTVQMVAAFETLFGMGSLYFLYLHCLILLRESRVYYGNNTNTSSRRFRRYLLAEFFIRTRKPPAFFQY